MNEPTALDTYEKGNEMHLKITCVEERIRSRMKELSALERGWFNGEGESIEDRLSVLTSDLLVELVRTAFKRKEGPEGIEHPWIFPTPKGGIEVEWDLGDWGIIATFHADVLAVAAIRKGTETEERAWDLSLEAEQNGGELYGALVSLLASDQS